MVRVFDYRGWPRRRRGLKAAATGSRRLWRGAALGRVLTDRVQGKGGVWGGCGILGMEKRAPRPLVGAFSFWGPYDGHGVPCPYGLGLCLSRGHIAMFSWM